MRQCKVNAGPRPIAIRIFRRSLSAVRWMFGRAVRIRFAIATVFSVCQLAHGSPGYGAPRQDQAALPFNAISGSDPNEAHTLIAKGGTFPEALYKTWFDAYERDVGVKVEYKAVGSGAGIKAITNRHVDFAASDAPMTTKQLNAATVKAGRILHIPTAFGAIALVYNIPGLQSPLRLTTQDITGIYLGEITHWNDGRLVADNPQLARVIDEIIVAHRSDGSGSTYGFTDYLSSHSDLWKRRSRNGISTGTSVTWPVGIGGRGGKGIVEVVKENPFSIGYVELGTALKNKLPFARVKNSAGQFVAPDESSIAAAAEASGQRASADLRFSVVDAPGAGAYPICTGTWLLVYRDMKEKDRATAVAVTRLLWWAIHDGQAANIALGYARLPAGLVTRAEQLVRQINVAGQPAFPGH